MRKGKSTKQKSEVAVRICDIRKNAGLTQEELAELLDISLSAYKKIELGENRVSVNCLEKIKQKLDVSADFILFGKQEELDEVWRLVLNSTEQNKMILLIRLWNYFTRVKPGKYITKEEQSVYDERLLEVLRRMEI